MRTHLEPAMPTMNYKGRRIELTDEMAEALEYALQRPKAWHSIGWTTEHKEAAKRLSAEGLVEIRDFSNQYRLTP
jgi:hypothetical protein